MPLQRLIMNFYDIVEADSSLKRRIHINEEWREFMMQNYAVIMGWIRYNKAIFIQDRNPGVPGVMYKIAPEMEAKHKSLKAMRELWIATVQLTGRPPHEIYTGRELILIHLIWIILFHAPMYPMMNYGI